MSKIAGSDRNREVISNTFLSLEADKQLPWGTEKHSEFSSLLVS